MTKQNNFLIFVLTIGVFSILNTEVGIIGILPLIADTFHVSVSQAGLLVSLFALVIAISGPTMPLVFSGINRKKVMLLVLGIFVLGNVASIFASNFTMALIARVIPAFFHPIYCSLAFSVAASLVSKEEAPKAVSKVMMGVSAGIVLGIPVTTFIASATSFKTAMLFFAIVNAIAFIATLLFVPSMPVKERLSYGDQLSVLKKSITWLSLAVVVFVGASLFAVYAYIADYLQTITNISGKNLSLALFLFGVASILGNLLAGKLLTKNAIKSVVSYPFALGAIYILLFFLGKFTEPMIIIVFVWGMLNGIGNNIQQYWIASAIPEAPDFANGLFIAFGNLGTTIGTAVGGLFISGMGTHYIVLGGLLFLMLTLVAVLLRNYMYSSQLCRGNEQISLAIDEQSN
jgi:DHA1 family inner membrane transport protein